MLSDAEKFVHAYLPRNLNTHKNEQLRHKLLKEINLVLLIIPNLFNVFFC